MRTAAGGRDRLKTAITSSVTLDTEPVPLDSILCLQRLAAGIATLNPGLIQEE
jgi:hypothetical protein